MDETFHLTPLDVRRYDFGKKAIGGYDPERVEQFREQVAEELERLARAQLDLEQKAKGFHEQLRAFRERDKAMNDALVSAQQLRGEIRESAERESALLVREARAEAESAMDDARGEIRKLELHLAELDRARRNHLTQLRVMAERHLAEIEAAENAPGPQFPTLARLSGSITNGALAEPA
jgi:DivIVA domain-containing protein